MDTHTFMTDRKLLAGKMDDFGLVCLGRGILFIIFLLEIFCIHHILIMFSPFPLLLVLPRLVYHSRDERDNTPGEMPDGAPAWERQGKEKSGISSNGRSPAWGKPGMAEPAVPPDMSSLMPLLPLSPCLSHSLSRLHRNAKGENVDK